MGGPTLLTAEPHRPRLDYPFISRGRRKHNRKYTETECKEIPWQVINSAPREVGRPRKAGSTPGLAEHRGLAQPDTAIPQGLAGLRLCPLLAEGGGVVRGAYQSRATCAGACWALGPVWEPGMFQAGGGWQNRR